MNEKVKAYLDGKKAEMAAQEEQRRREILVEEGLYTKVYPTEEEYDDLAYPEWDEEKGKAYRAEPFSVTEEEFRQIEKYAGYRTEMGVGEKLMNLASAVLWIGILSAVVGGIALMMQDEDLIIYGILTAVAGSVTSWITSLFIRAFGQLVEDTHMIRKKVEEEA